jgi:hypothetical protein
MSKIAEEARNKALATGLLPHEILLSMARGEPQREVTIDPTNGKVTGETYSVPDLECRRDSAKAAAPYFAPKISTVEVIQGVNDYELDRIIAQLASEAGLGAGPVGEGETGEEGSPPPPAARRRVRVD